MARSTMARVGLAALATLVACSDARQRVAEGDPQVLWSVDSLSTIGGHPVLVLGAPAVVGGEEGRAMLFDGVDDGLELPVHPLAGAEAFTVEAVFRPDPGGAREQRFLHLQEDASDDRILLEIRVAGAGASWFLDTYVKSQGEGHALFAKEHEHAIGPWYHAALVVAGGQMRHYVNGESEMSRPVDFRPQSGGRTSIGVRINRVSWFRGAIRQIRFTRRALAPEEFLGP